MASSMADYEAASQALGSRRFSVAKAYQSIPEASDHEWTDGFFEGEDGIVAVFDFDYVQIVDFRTKTALAGLIPSLGCMSAYGALMGGASYAPITAVAAPAGFLLVTLTPCFLKKQIEWEAYAQHVAVTVDGIRFVQDKRKSCWGLPMCDKGRHSKTVPFDKITDCDIVEPAGNECLCIPRVLMTVNVDTASSGGEGKQYELKISGLQDAHRFKQLVWAMKRATRGGGGVPTPTGGAYVAPQALEMEMADRGTPKKVADGLARVQSGESNSTVKNLLRDIRTELRENNQLMREMKEKEGKGNPGSDGGAGVTAPPVEKGEMA